MILTTRRVFLKTAAAVYAAGAIGSGQRRAVGEDSQPMKFAFCNEPFKDWPQEKIFRFLAECGYGGVEIAPFTIARSVTDIPAKRRAELKSRAADAGIEIVGLHWLLAETEGLHLTSPDRAVRDKTSRYLGELARFCADLGGKVMVFGSPKQRSLPPDVSPKDGTKYAAEVLRAAMPAIKEAGVVLALEPLSPQSTNFLTTAAEALALAERVDSPHCRIMLDCNAMSTEKTSIPELIRTHHRAMVHFHANDPNRRGPGMGDLDFRPIFAALREVDYRGWISVEPFDYAPGPERLARESIAYLRKLEAATTTSQR